MSLGSFIKSSPIWRTGNVSCLFLAQTFFRYFFVTLIKFSTLCRHAFIQRKICFLFYRNLSCFNGNPNFIIHPSRLTIMFYFFMNNRHMSVNNLFFKFYSISLSYYFSMMFLMVSQVPTFEYHKQDSDR